MSEAKNLLMEADYTVVVGLVRDDIVKVTYPNNKIQFWGIEKSEDDDNYVISDLAYDEVIECPGYAVPWALTARIHLDCQAINYNPAYIFYVDEQGVEVGGMIDVLPVSDTDLEQYEALTTILRNVKSSQSLESAVEWATQENVLEGFEVCFNIANQNENEAK